MHSHVDAVIIGAAPAGSALAILLARQRWRVALVERHAFPRRTVGGERVAPENFPLLKSLGVWRAFEALDGSPVHEAVLATGSRLTPLALPRGRRAEGWGRTAGREYLDLLLLGEARECGITLLQPWTVREVAGGPGDFRCTLINVAGQPERQLSAPVVVVAHARGATATRREGLSRGKARYRAPASQPAALPPGTALALSLPGGYGALLPAGEGAWSLDFCLSAGALAAAGIDPLHPRAPALAAAAVIAASPPARDVLADAAPEGAWLAPASFMPLPRLGGGGQVFRVGSAAGDMHALLGDGLGLSLTSASLLAGVLGAPGPALRSPRYQATLQWHYREAWRRACLPRARQAAWLAGLSMRPWIAGAAAPLAARIAAHRPPALRRAAVHA